ncbi:hypothetical protein B296_00055676 [Ensete ventricosum]|uniref:Retrotransposon gag domain-containing protein n=1 Tax=Ensete ventricosum TaxID=4639 RepID=A0A426X229_ENSVE|nr:hypothetical protein B296_00055676 [Ensete ventricosum]
MALYGTSDAIMCQAFSTTLRGIARGWYDRLPLTSIHSFDQLVREFEANFLASVQSKPTPVSLLGMRQKEDEHLSLYLTHFTEEIRAIPDTHPTPQNPQPDRTRANERDYGCYSHFHHDYGHNIEECHDLKNQIEDLIRRGHLDRYIRKPRELSLCPKGPVERQVDVIIGSPIVGGDSSSAMKAYAHVKVQKRPRAWGDLGITFESKSEYPDHDDALVIMAYIANARVRCQAHHDRYRDLR